MVVDYSDVKKWLIAGFEKNNFRVREMQMPGDDFRLVLSPMGDHKENSEVYKTKDSLNIVCAAGILLGGKKREKFFKLPKEKRNEFAQSLEKAKHVEKLDHFEVEDNSKDFRVSMQCEVSIQEISGEIIINCMNNVFDAGKSIQDIWNEYFDKLMQE